MAKNMAGTAVGTKKANTSARLEDHIEQVKARAFEIYLERTKSAKAGNEISDWVAAENDVKKKYNIA